MKIGILSMQEVKNYGSFLQAFSLKKNIEELDMNVILSILSQENRLENISKNAFISYRYSLKGYGAGTSLKDL